MTIIYAVLALLVFVVLGEAFEARAAASIMLGFRSLASTIATPGESSRRRLTCSVPVIEKKLYSAFFGPLSLLVLFALWAFGLIVGFACACAIVPRDGGLGESIYFRRDIHHGMGMLRRAVVSHWRDRGRYRVWLLRDRRSYLPSCTRRSVAGGASRCWIPCSSPPSAGRCSCGTQARATTPFLPGSG